MIRIHLNDITKHFIYITLTYRKINSTLISNKSSRTFLNLAYYVWKRVFLCLQPQSSDQTLGSDVLHIASINNEVTNPLVDGAPCLEDLLSLIIQLLPWCEQ